MAKSLPMMRETQNLERMVAALADRTAFYLAKEMAIDVTDVREAGDRFEALTLEHLTALVGVGGPSGMLVAFSYSPELADALVQRMADALELSDDEVDAYRDASLSEIANVITGNWIADFAPPGERVSLTPPVILEGARRIHRVPDATFRSVTTVTHEGLLSIYLIGPQNMFDHFLNAR